MQYSSLMANFRENEILTVPPFSSLDISLLTKWLTFPCLVNSDVCAVPSVKGMTLLSSPPPIILDSYDWWFWAHCQLPLQSWKAVGQPFVHRPSTSSAPVFSLLASCTQSPLTKLQPPVRVFQSSASLGKSPAQFSLRNSFCLPLVVPYVCLLSPWAYSYYCLLPL